MFRYFLILIFSFSFLTAKTVFRFNPATDQQFEQLVEDLYGDMNEQIYAVEILRRYKTKIPIRSLLYILSRKPSPKFVNISDKEPYLKMRILKLIRIINDPLATPELIKTYQLFIKEVNKNDKPEFYYIKKNEPMVLVTGELLKTLGSLPYDKNSENLIKTALQHQNLYIQESAIMALKFLNEKKNLDLLEEKLKKEKNPVLKVVLLHAILYYDIESDQYLNEAYSFLKHDNYKVRLKATELIRDLDLLSASTYLENAILIEEEALLRKKNAKDFERN